MTKSSILRRRLAGDEIIVLPGAYDALSAKLIEQAGFCQFFTTGFGLAASTLGEPDIGLLTQTETLDRARRIAHTVDIPLVADMDTGYGNPINVIRTVRECVQAGIAGIILEDQEWPKRCGHLEGKRVVPAGDHVQKLRAAVHARGDDDLVIIARTDARAVHGVDDAIERSHANVEAGADVVFIEAPRSMDELRAVRAAFDPDVPLFANMIEDGVTPFLSAAELQDLGYKMVVYPLSGLFAATAALQRTYAALVADGTTAAAGPMAGLEEFKDIIGVPAYGELEREFVSAN